MVEKGLEILRYRWDIPTVHTIIADNKKRVRIPDAEPGQVYAYETTGEGQFKLTLIKPVETAEDRPAKVTFVKEGGFTVMSSDRPIDEDALKQALSEFP
jgi:hypothetical protein